MVIINEKEYLNITETRDYIKKNTLNNAKVALEDLRNRAQKQIDSKTDLYTYDTAIRMDNDYYIEFDFLKKNIELFNKSEKASVVYSGIKKFSPKKSNAVLYRVLNDRFGAYMIPLFGTSTIYINSDDCSLILSEVEKIHNKNCITRKELLEKIFSTYAGLKSEATIDRLIVNALDKYNLETILPNYKYNIINSGSILYPEKTVQSIFKYFNEAIVNEVKLVNMTYDDYLSLSADDFKNNYIEFTKKQAERIKCGSKYINEFKELERTFKSTDIKIIKVNNQGIYASKKELEEFADLMSNYIVASSYFKEIGIDFQVSVAKANGINCFRYKHVYYIKKEDVDYYKSVDEYNKSLKETISLHDRVKLKLDCFQHKKQSNYPNTRKLVLDFAKGSDASLHTASDIYRLYRSILDNIKLDLAPANQSENNELFRSVLNIYQDKSSKMTKFIIRFMNFLRNKKGFNLMTVSTLTNRDSEKKPYTPEEFINLLSAMLSIVSDEQKIKKLYRDWHLSTSFSYVFLHYCLAWRRNDLVDNLPIVDLSLVSNDVTDGESFIKWLEDGNKLSDKQSRYICETLEEETRRLRKKASKNKELLNCIISDSLMWEVATLLCINEANRQIFLNNFTNKNIRKDRSFIKPYTDSGKIYEQFYKKLNINITQILNGNFDNTRMNKGFINLVRDKAEELNLFAYSYAQIIRSHKFSPGKLSETTKIYLNKNIDRGSLLSFSTGTMGSVLYLLKQLVDNDFNFKSTNKQIEDIKDLNLTPYQLEKSIHSISNKITILEEEMRNYFTGHGTKEEFLTNLLYGQNFSGIEKKTKCLIKITRDNQNTLSISPIESINDTPNNSCPLKRRSCIGCDYMIALRYFIYEFEKKYNQVLTNLENAESKIDKGIFIHMINELYVPLLNDLAMVLGPDQVYEIVDLNRLQSLA